MDPLTSFGLAASIVQFVNFATSLINQTYKIHASAAGTTDRAQELEEHYHILLQFSSRLDNKSPLCLSDAQVHHDIEQDITSLIQLKSVCKEHCQTLLDIVSGLKLENGNGRLFRSFRIACRALSKEKRIAELEVSLHSLQTQMTLHLCNIAHHFHEEHAFVLAGLRRQAYTLEVDLSKRLDHLADVLSAIHCAVTEKDRANLALSLPEVENLQREFDKLSITERGVSRDLHVVRSLTFENYVDRYHAITEAHLKTLGWIFDPKHTGSEGLRLSKWLREGEGVFWVSGKPGSGKSTLMKFIADNFQTQRELSTWAGSQSRVVTSSHYFWWTGTRLQKSQEGLLRMLLYGIFRKCPELIQRVCREEWEEATPIGHLDPQSDQNWSFEKLRAIIESLARQPPLNTKFCFFIDGLDEYEGDHLDICKILKDLAASPCVKICVSSRPWNEFKLAFGDNDQKIMVHDLTIDDIRGYTRSRLSEHPAWSMIYGQGRSSQAKELTELIVQRAEGVFLWVFLVTQLLREGLSNSDSMRDLYRRVENFPPDLERFFIQMLESVDGFYHQKMSTALQLALVAENPMNLSVYAFHEEEYDNPDYALDMEVKCFSDTEVQKQHQTVERRLNGWCKGLLEVHGREVHFLHRTVADFLRTGEMVDFLEKKAPANFNTSLSVLKAYTAWIKSGNFPNLARASHENAEDLQDELSLGPYETTTRRLQKVYNRYYTVTEPEIYNPAEIQALTSEALLAASRIERAHHCHSTSHQAMFIHLDAIDTTIQELESHVLNTNSKRPQTVLMKFRTNILQNALALYLDRTLSRDPTYFHGLQEPTLSILLDTFLVSEDSQSHGLDIRSSLWPTEICATFRCLLEKGHGPNGIDENSDTPFKKLSSLALPWNGDPWKACTAPIFRQRLLSLFLGFGADPITPIKRDGILYSNPWFDFLMAAFRVPCEPSEEDAYLSELDAFLKKDDLGLQVPMQFPASVGCSWGEILDACPHEAFFLHLSNRKESGGSASHIGSTRFLGKVSSRLLRRMHDEGIEVRSAYRSLQKSLPAALYSSIKSQHDAFVIAERRKKQKKDRKLKALRIKNGDGWVAYGRRVGSSAKSRRSKEV